MQKDGHLKKIKMCSKCKANCPPVETFVPSCRDSVFDALIEKINAEKREFIKKMFVSKGYGHLLDAEQTRFPMVTICIREGWEYYFVNNGTKQGEFIVAVGPFEFNDTGMMGLDIGSAVSQSVSFNWQDTDYSAVMMR